MIVIRFMCITLKELFVSLYNNTIVNKNKISILTNEGDDDNFVS